MEEKLRLQETFIVRGALGMSPALVRSCMAFTESMLRMQGRTLGMFSRRSICAIARSTVRPECVVGELLTARRVSFDFSLLPSSRSLCGLVDLPSLTLWCIRIHRLSASRSLSLSLLFRRLVSRH